MGGESQISQGRKQAQDVVISRVLGKNSFLDHVGFESLLTVPYCRTPQIKSSVRAGFPTIRFVSDCLNVNIHLGQKKVAGEC